MATAEDRLFATHHKTPSTVGDLIAASNAPVPSKSSRSARDDLSLFSFQGASPPPSNLTLRAHLLRAGFLQKQTSNAFNRTFVQRWFQLYCYPQRLEYLSEKNSVVTIQLDAGVELLDPTSDKPTEFTLRTLDRSWVLQAANEEECKQWQRDLQTVIDLAATYDTDLVEPVERAIEQLQEQLVYGHLKYNGKVFLRDIHGQAAGYALGRAKEKLREAEYLLGNKANLETFKIILSNYRSCLTLADDLVQALWMRIHAQDLMEKFYNSVQTTESFLRKGESELNNAKAHWEVARSLLDQLRTTPEYRRNRGVTSSTSEPVLTRVPSGSISMSTKELEGSSPAPQPSPTASITDASTKETAPPPVLSPLDTTGFIDDVQVMIDDITRRKLIENIETRISIALTRRRPSLAAGVISPLDRALITLQQLMRATGTMFKGTSFMTDKRLKPIKEKLEEFRLQLEEFKSVMGHDPSAKTSISRYEFAWLRLQQQMAALQRRAEVHDFIEQINTLASRTGLALAGRRQSTAADLWVRTKDLVARLRQIRDEEPLLEEKDLEDGLEEDAGVTINTASSRASTNLSRRGAGEKAALYMLDIDFFMVQWKKRAEEMESKFASISKELSQASDSDSATGLGK